MISSSDWIVDGRLQGLLAQWVELQEAGSDVSPEELCRDSPELAGPLSSMIERLHKTEWIFREPCDTALRGDSGTETALEQILEECGTLTLDQFRARIEVSRILSDDGMKQTDQFNGDSAHEFARWLIDQGLLTEFQVRECSADRGGELLVDDYLILEPIGEGGMGTVFRAEHRTTKRIVALKMLRRTIEGTPAVLARFRREIQAAAQLNHPNVVIVHDAGDDNGRLYLAMEYVDGPNLHTLVKIHGPLTGERAVEYVQQAARAVEYAHGRGIVHRDVKPSNLLLGPDGTVKMLDLGLARFLGAEQSAGDQSPVTLTSTGQVMGTADYLAPEQALESRSADERCDIYSLGCTLYYLLHGRPLYERESLAGRLLAHQSTPAPALADGREDIPEALTEVFLRMVAKRPEDRPRTMTDVVETLGRIFENPAQTSPEDVFRRRKWRRGVVGGVAVLILGIAISYWRPSAGPEDLGGSATPMATDSTGDSVAPRALQSPPTAVVPFDADEAAAHQQAWAEYLGVPVEYQNSIGMTFRLIPPGEFEMGTSKERLDVILEGVQSEYERQIVGSEFPPHTVRISQPFYLAAQETTQAHYLQIVGLNPSYSSTSSADAEDADGHSTDECPVESVTWFDTVAFCNTLSELHGLEAAYKFAGTTVRTTEGDGYRLPSAAQWEYAASAGSAGDYCCGELDRIGEFAWFDRNSGTRTHPVGLLQPNSFGLYDVHGNVSEWCADWFQLGYYRNSPEVDPLGPVNGNRRVIRGGTYRHADHRGRLQTQSAFAPDDTLDWAGIRIMLPVEAVKRMILERESQPPPAVAPFSIEQAAGHQQAWASYLNVPLEYENSLGMRFRLIPPGEFEMGSAAEKVLSILTDDDPQSYWSRLLRSEIGAHTIRIPNAFYVSTFEVTQDEFAAVVGENPSESRSEDSGIHPVESVNFLETIHFCNELSWQTGLEPVYRLDGSQVTWTAGSGYQLSTEARWEFACRSGSLEDVCPTAGSTFPGDYGWIRESAEQHTYAVGQLPANAFGIHDMHGNVSEWCWDYYDPEYYSRSPVSDPEGPSTGDLRVVRGGNWDNGWSGARASTRAGQPPERRGRFGIRLVLPVDAVREAANR